LTINLLFKKTIKHVGISMKIFSTISLVFLLTLTMQSNAMQRGFEKIVQRHPYLATLTAATSGAAAGATALYCYQNGIVPTASDIKNIIGKSAHAAHSVIQSNRGIAGIFAGTLLGALAVMVTNKIVSQENSYISPMPRSAPPRRWETQNAG
jgi:hypothetical protein